MRGWALVLPLALVSCAVEGTIEKPTPGLHRMVDQPRADAYEGTSVFANGMVMRHPPSGTVRYGAAGEAVPEFDVALMREGRRDFEIFCAACHGVRGDANTVVAEDMTLRRPPSLHSERVRGHSDERLFRIASDGYGVMPGYAGPLDERQRWAVVAYVRALQLSQGALVSQLPQRTRRALREATR